VSFRNSDPGVIVLQKELLPETRAGTHEAPDFHPNTTVRIRRAAGSLQVKNFI